MSDGVRTILRDALIVVVLRGLGGFLVAAATACSDDPKSIQVVAQVLLMAVGFCIAGVLVKESRFKHLALVAVAVWLVSALNILMADLTVVLWIKGILPTGVAMLLGGGASMLLARRSPAAAPEPPASDPPASGT